MKSNPDKEFGRRKEKSDSGDSHSRDEMNLAEFPMALLDARQRPAEKSICFSDEITGKDGQIVQRKWTLTGSDQFGLPLEGDEQVTIALMEITQQDGFANQEIHFTRYDLLQRMGWPDTGPYYKRIEQALDRLISVTIKAENAWWDNEKKTYVTRAFHIIDNYTLFDRGEKKGTQINLALSTIKWNDVVWRSFQTGYLKRFDTQRYFRLRTATARRLFRYLDKKFGKKNTFQIDVFRLAHEHLGMTRSFRYVSKIKERLGPASQELINDGYLESFVFRPSPSDAKSSIVQFVRAQGARLPEAQDPAGYFYKKLLGVDEITRPITASESRQARDFIKTHGITAFRLFVDYTLAQSRQKWPDMATLTGAFRAYQDAFLKDWDLQHQNEQRLELQQQAFRREQQLLPHWYAYLDPQISRFQQEHPDDWSQFEDYLDDEPSFQRYTRPSADPNDPDRLYYFHKFFADFFADTGILDFVDWREQNEKSILGSTPPDSEN